MSRSVMPKIASTLFVSLLILCSGAVMAEGIAAFHDDCSLCHRAETPSADNADPEVCFDCHGETPDVGSVSVNGKDVNPHQGHFDVYECSSCHPAHRPPVVGCAECHTVSGADMPNK